MIEMLSVLAIIGVLSAGGVWGYNVAMENYRFNKFVSETQTMVASARSFFAQPSKSTTLGAAYWADTLQKIGIVPKNYTLIASCSAKYLYPCIKAGIGKVSPVIVDFANTAGTTRNAFNGKTLVYLKKYTSFAFHLLDVPKKHCVKIMTYNWGSGYNIYTTKTSLPTNEVRVVAPLTPTEAELFCEDTTPEISLAFHLRGVSIR